MSILVLRLCQLARTVNFLLDQGHHLDLLETRRHVLDGDLLPWMDRRFRQHNLRLSAIPTVDQAAVHEVFEDLALVRTEHRYAVQSNGLCLVLAFCVEAIQALRPSQAEA